MITEWVTDPSQIKQYADWHPGAIPDEVIDMAVLMPTMVTSVAGEQFAVVQGFMSPDVPDTWLVQSAYFRDANPKAKRVWLRRATYHQQWVKCCKELQIDACVIKYAQGSAVEQAYGQNSIPLFPQLYENISWFQTDDGLSYQRFEIVA